MKNNLTKQSGYTLIELLVYLALVAVITTIFTGFTADVVKSSVRARISKEVEQNAETSLSRIVQEIKNAKKDLVIVNVNRIRMLDQNDTTVEIFYDTTNQSIYYNNGVTNIPLNNTLVKVTQLEFEPTSGHAIVVRLSVEYKKNVFPSLAPYNLQLVSTVVPRYQIY